MKWLLGIGGILCVIAFGWLPFKGTDVAMLEPAEILYVAFEDGVLVETERGWYGKGATVEEAVQDLKTTSPGQVFLQTVDYLLVQQDSRFLLPDLYPYLRTGCMLCITEEKPDLQKAGQYLRAHRPAFTLLDVWTGNEKIPKLTMEEEKTYLDGE